MNYTAILMAQILKSAGFTKTQKSWYLENQILFFLQIKKHAITFYRSCYPLKWIMQPLYRISISWCFECSFEYLYPGIIVSMLSCIAYPGIDSWVSWVEPGLPRKPSSKTQKTLLSWVHPYSYVGMSWVSWVLKNYELGFEKLLAGFWKIVSWV